MEIMFVSAEMISKSVDPLGEESNLHLGRTGIIIMCAELGDDGLFLFGLKRHTYLNPFWKNTIADTKKPRSIEHSTEGV